MAGGGGSLLRPLEHLSPDQRDAFLERLSETEVGVMASDFASARATQVAPGGAWTTWLILAGRGFGKTRTGATWVNDKAVQAGGTRIALIGATMADARQVMVEGDAGVLTRAGLPMPKFEPSRRQVTWSNGSTAMLFSAAEPDTLRGPSFHFAWGDEAARWTKGPAVLSNLRMGLRLGPRPRLLLTTTPRPLPWLKTLATMHDGSGVVMTHGRTIDNSSNLPASFLDAVVGDYGGTRLGRQELDGEMIEDLEGALWTRAGLEAARVAKAPQIMRTLIGVDPPVTSGSSADACGIVVVGLGSDGRAYVLADRSIQGAAPDGWARAVAGAADEYSADQIIAEVNNGGELVATVLRNVVDTLPLKTVHASVGKVARAEPVAALYGLGRVMHVGVFPALEDEMCGMLIGGSYAGPTRSPDRADALVWALNGLMLGKRATKPGVRSI